MNEVQELRERVIQLEGLLRFNETPDEQIALAARYGLSRTQAKMTEMLLKRDLVQAKSLYTMLYGMRPECDQPDEDVVAVHLCKLRKALDLFDIAITTRWGFGWYFDAETKARIRGEMRA